VARDEFGIYDRFPVDILHLFGSNGFATKVRAGILAALDFAAGLVVETAAADRQVHRERLAARIAVCPPYHNGYGRNHRAFRGGLKDLTVLTGRDNVTLCLLLAHCIGEKEGDDEVFPGGSVPGWALAFTQLAEATVTLAELTHAPQLGMREIKRMKMAITE
jgi:hypothetical protein